MPDVPDVRRPTLVETLAEMPTLLERLAAEHRDDGRGRCTGCRTPGYGTPGDHWPCAPARLARDARALIARRGAAGEPVRGAARDPAREAAAEPRE